MIWFRERKALEFVNGIRDDLDLDPMASMLPGQPRLAGHCPVACTIAFGDDTEGRQVLVVSDKVSVYDNGCAVREAMTDEATRSWIRSFDRGEIPELIA